MRLAAFRVQMYKGILDSGWVDLSDLTVIVGKNEAGKTSLLKALHKFNPFRPEPYIISREWPRGRRREQNERQVVCSVRFTLEAPELERLSDLAGQPVAVESVIVTRDYGGRLETIFPDGPFPDRLHPNEVDRLSDEFPGIPSPVGDSFRKVAEDRREEARLAAKEGRFSALESMAQEHAQALAQALSGGHPHRANEDSYRTQYTSKLQELLQRLPSLPTVHARAHEYIVEQLPTFIYMDDYRAFKGTARLDEVKQRKDQGRLTDEDKTLVTILELAGLALEDEFRKSTGGDREERQYDLDDAAKTLTRDIAHRWKQKKYEVQFRADGPQFFTMVQDDTNVGLIRLEERSKGFQWFFSFDLMFMHESRGTFENCVLLLDEPGLHLHPEGQRDLLERLEAYATANPVIYTTHLPFMIDLRLPDRIKVMSETAEGAKVTENLMDSQPEAKFTLQAALGMTGRTSYLVAQRNLVVEGASDFWIVSELSRLLTRSGQEALPEDVFITAAGGAAEAGYIATFMIGQKLDVAVLLDSDKAGNEAREKLVSRWLTRYQGKATQVVSLAEALGVTGRELAIEDLFTEDFYLGLVAEAHAKELAAAGSPKLDGTGNDPLCKRAERLLQQHGIRFNKGRVANLLKQRLAKARSLDELPEPTRTYAPKLFKAIRMALPGS